MYGGTGFGRHDQACSINNLQGTCLIWLDFRDTFDDIGTRGGPNSVRGIQEGFCK